MKKKLRINMIGRLVPFALVFGAGIIFSNHYLNQSPSPLERKVTSIIRENQKTLKELRTARLTTTTTISVVKKNRWETWFGNIPLGSIKIRYRAVGEIDAGINLSEGYTVSQIDKNTVKITLPAPKVLDVKLDVNRSNPISTERNWIAPNAERLISQAQRTAVSSLKKEACNNGILQQARISAQKTVEELAPAGVNLEVKIKGPH